MGGGGLFPIWCVVGQWPTAQHTQACCATTQQARPSAQGVGCTWPGVFAIKIKEGGGGGVQTSPTKAHSNLPGLGTLQVVPMCDSGAQLGLEFGLRRRLPKFAGLPKLKHTFCRATKNTLPGMHRQNLRGQGPDPSLLTARTRGGVLF